MAPGVHYTARPSCGRGEAPVAGYVAGRRAELGCILSRFRDNIDRASRSGVRYVVQAGGSNRDDEVIDAANEYGMVMAFANLRLFHH